MTIGFFGRKCPVLFWALFFLFQISSAFSSDDIGSLISQGDKALAQGDYEQTFLQAKAVLNADPRNLAGYRLALSYCVMMHWELGFNKMVEEAKNNGVDKLAIDRLAAVTCFLGRQTTGLDRTLAEYEAEWRKIYDPYY